MNTWPSEIPLPQLPFSGEHYKRALRTEFEDGSVQSRPVHLRARERFKLSWNALTEFEYQVLKQFFNDNQGLTFTWTNPVTEELLNVRFDCDAIAWQVKTPGYRYVELSIAED